LADPLSRAVFLSYASQDTDAARRICEALRAAGIEVWFDQSELRGGDAWDQKIRRQIRDCALFVPIISADQRTQMIARNKTFIVPVCVDATPDAGTDVPDSFLRVQWTRLPAGETPAAFGQRIATLLGMEAAITRQPQGAAPPSSAGAPGNAAPPSRIVAAPRRARLIAAIAVGAGVLAAAIAFQPWRMMTGKSNPGRAAQEVLRKSGEHLRITAQLVRADNGFHLWSQTYDRDVRDIFAVQARGNGQSATPETLLMVLIQAEQVVAGPDRPQY
jgi:hypothetical protein